MSQRIWHCLLYCTLHVHVVAAAKIKMRVAAVEKVVDAMLKMINCV